MIRGQQIQRRGQDSFLAWPQLTNNQQLVITNLVIARACGCAWVGTCSHDFSPFVTCFVPLGQTVALPSPPTHGGPSCVAMNCHPAMVKLS